MGYRQRAFDLAQRLDKRAAIRRSIPDRKSVQEGKPDRIADQLEEAAKFLRQEIVIGPRTADMVRIVLAGGIPTDRELQAVRDEVGDIDDVIPF